MTGSSAMRLRIWVIVLGWCVAGLVQADEARAKPRVLSLTVSGGVSLGSFEAGALYFVTESVKRSEGEVQLRIATGASAGSANSLITLMDSCLPEVDDPTHSMGYETWVPVGLDALFDPRRVTATSILSRAPLQAAMKRVKARWLKGLRENCDVVLGVSVTRKTPALVSLTKQVIGPAVEVPRSSEWFVVRMQGRGAGKAPILRNYVDPARPLAQPLLPLSAAEDDAAQARNFDRLLELVYASAAFPLAFAPFQLEFCETEPRWMAGRPGAAVDPLACARPWRAAFIDGGLFDNSPLRLNYRIVQRFLREDPAGRARWLELAEPHPGGPPAVRYAYVDPAASSYPSLDAIPEAVKNPSALDMLLELSGSLVEASRRRELLALIEDTSEGPDALENLDLTQNQLPPVASQLGAFFGFFERDFRALDFYLGMYDGLVSVRRALELERSPEAAAERLSSQFPVLQKPLRGDLPRGMLPFACLLSQVESAYAGHASACDGAELRNFRILLQVTLDRLHHACARVKESALPPQASPLCFAGARGQPRVHVRGVPVIAAEQCARENAEGDFGYTLRLLGAYGFEFRDLGLDRDEAEYGAVKIRRRLLTMAEALAGKQPTPLTEALIATVGRAAANQIVYEPPRSWLYLTAGTAIEIGASLLPFSWNDSWARINLALQFSNWESIATPQRFTLAISPLIGPELQLLFLSTAALQVMIGARVGWQASMQDHAGFRDCESTRALGDARNCSQLVLQGYLATALIERLRAQFVLEFYPTDQPIDFKSHLALQLSFGLQLF